MLSLFLHNNCCLFYITVNLIDLLNIWKNTLSARLLSDCQLLMTCHGVHLKLDGYQCC